MNIKTVANCEKSFIIQCLQEKQRLDHRRPFSLRPADIEFRQEYGSVVVRIGRTRVLAQTSCKIVKPKETRPNEGRLRILLKNIHLLSFSFDAGRQSQWTTTLSRHLLQNIQDSRCVDMESLCIVAYEHVWEIVITLNVLDYDGNMLDCANIAALCALSHFRCPAVTIKGFDVYLHSTSERNPVPIRILHLPIMITFALFENGEHMLVDACDAEEKVMEGLFSVGLNQHKELSCLAMLGEISLSRDQIQNCITLAHGLVLDLTKLIRNALNENEKLHAKQMILKEQDKPKILNK